MAVSLNLSLAQQQALAEAQVRLAQGEVVAFPTETVYGLAADAEADEAVAKIYRLKGRPDSHPLIVHVLDATQARRWVRQLTPLAQTLMARYWPGPLTLVLERAPGVANRAAAGLPSIALRAPAHPLARALLQGFKGGAGGLAAPSVNRFGAVSATRAEHVREEFGDALFVLDGGACSGGIESTIVDARGTEPVLLRPGLLSAERIKQETGLRLWLPEELQPLTQVNQPSTTTSTPGAKHAPEPGYSAPAVSGALASHYAPRTPLLLLPAEHPLWLPSATWQTQEPGHRIGALLWGAALPQLQSPWVLRLPADASGYAHALYDALRRLDTQHLATIYVLEPPTTNAWQAIQDRLHKAAAPRS